MISETASRLSQHFNHSLERSSLHPFMKIRDHLPLFMVVLLHVALALVFAQITPYRSSGILLHQGKQMAPDIGAPDERQHANYVQHLKDGKGLPVFDPKAADLNETYQSHQPPLYYLIAAGYSSALGVRDVRDQSAKVKVRSLNAFIGGAGVAGVYCLCLWAFGRRDWAVTAAAIAALLPMNLALSGAVSNDPLLMALCSWTLAVAMRGVAQGWTLKLAITAGALLGLALLTKTSALALVLPCLVAIAWPKACERKAVLVVSAVAATLLLVGGWWLRSINLYGDPFALSAFNEAFQNTAQAGPFIEQLGAFGYWTGINDYGLGVGWWTLRSLLGVFGYMDIFLPSTIYGVFILLLAVGFGGWLWWARTEGKEVSRQNVVLAMFLGVVVLLYIRFNAQYFQAQARYLLPAISVLSTGLTIGFFKLTAKRPIVGWAVIVGWLVISLALAITILPDEFAKRLV